MIKCSLLLVFLSTNEGSSLPLECDGDDPTWQFVLISLCVGVTQVPDVWPGPTATRSGHEAIFQSDDLLLFFVFNYFKLDIHDI